MTDLPPRNIRLLLEYEGTAYAGWQLQNEQPTVQGMVAEAIRKALGERVTLYGASRTDAGVHARGQVANFRTSSGLVAWKMAHAINAHLPEDVAVLEAADVPDDFHSQFMAKGKLYRYWIRHSMHRSAIDRNFAYLVRGPLDDAAMRATARHYEGKRDFRAFATQNDAKKNTVRTMKRVSLEREGDNVVFEVEGDGFLYNMVRTMVGTMVKAGKGALDPASVPAILESKDRRKAGPVAPSRGLTLMRVDY